MDTLTLPDTGCVPWKKVPVTPTVLFGLMATTRAVSVAPAAADDALMVPKWVPSVNLVCWVPVVNVASKARAEVLRFVPAFAVTVPETGCVPWKKVPVTATLLLGLTVTTKALSEAIAAVLAALTVVVLVPSVIRVVCVPPVSVASRASPLVVPIFEVTVQDPP